MNIQECSFALRPSPFATLMDSQQSSDIPFSLCYMLMLFLLLNAASYSPLGAHIDTYNASLSNTIMITYNVLCAH